MSRTLALLSRDNTTEPPATEPDHFIDNSLCCCTCGGGEGDNQTSPSPTDSYVISSFYNRLVDSAQTHRLGTSLTWNSFHHFRSSNVVRHIKSKHIRLGAWMTQSVKWEYGLDSWRGQAFAASTCTASWTEARRALFLSMKLATYLASRSRMSGCISLLPHTSI
jgi:hypothetical protein